MCDNTYQGSSDFTPLGDPIHCAEMYEMNDNEPTKMSNDVENIVVKPDSIEVLVDVEDSFWIQSDGLENPIPQILHGISGEYFCVLLSGEVVPLNIEDIVQAPFCLESYFMGYDDIRSGLFCIPHLPQKVVEIDRVTCYECDIVFCNEHRLLEHLMTHIDIYRMGCDICDKDLNMEEKFQLHAMAVTWQSIYYCDYCRKSCAGVVRSKDQTPPPGKTYMCHDCEYRMKEETLSLHSIMQSNDHKMTPSVGYLPKPQPLVPSLSGHESGVEVLPSSFPPPSSTEPLRDHKQKPNHETKIAEQEVCPAELITAEVQDCFLNCKPTVTKENKKHRQPKPKIRVVRESMKQTLKISTRSRTREKNKQPTRSYRCRYCPSAFNEDHALIMHLKEKHELHRLKYICKLCGKDFRQQRCYENHMTLHKVAKNHMCFVCNFTFLSKRELEQHAKEHDESEIIRTYCESQTAPDVALDLRKRKRKSSG